MNCCKLLILLLNCLIFCVATNERKSDYSKKAKVKLSEILKENRKYRSETWPPDESQDEYLRIGVKLLGDKNSAIFHPSLKPSMQQLNSNRLKKLFWKYNLDQEWLSVNKPIIMKGVLPNKNNLNKAMQDISKSLNFTFTDSVGTLLEIPENMQKLFKTWLLDYSSCRMNFVWEDLGEIFWPRWIRRGICSNDRSCSWPSGMACKANGSKILYLLRWVCEKDSDGSKSQAHRMYMLNLKEKKMQRKRMYRSHKRRRRFRENARKNPSSNLKKKQRRAVRIVRRLSKAIDGYFCQWSMLKYYISDKCSCECK